MLSNFKKHTRSSLNELSYVEQNHKNNTNLVVQKIQNRFLQQQNKIRQIPVVYILSSYNLKLYSNNKSEKNCHIIENPFVSG